MKKFFMALLLSLAFIVPAFSTAGRNAQLNETEGSMAYCTIADLNEAYGEDRINGWSRLDPDTASRAVRNAAAEIDGYLISGGYTVPLAGPPENLKKYCIDIAAANLVISAGVLDNDPGGKAVLDEAKNARHYLEKVAEGKFKIPGYADGEDESSSPPGGVLVSASSRLDLRGF